MFDVTLNGTKARVVRDDPDLQKATFRPFFRRQESGAEVEYKSNALRRPQAQRSWEGGSTWWRPTLSQAGEDKSYYRGSLMDGFSHPGQVLPLPLLDLATTNALLPSNSGVNALSTKATEWNDKVYLAGGVTDTTGSVNLYEYSLTSHGYTQFTNKIFPASAQSLIHHGTSFFILSGNRISMISDSAGTLTDTVGVTNQIAGACLLVTPYEELWYWDGNSMLAWDMSSTALTEVTDDGLGKDWLSGKLAASASATVFALAADMNPLAVSTPSGVYYVKNVTTQSKVTPWVFRVEKDDAGNIISTPIVTLPPGTVCLGITSFLDSIILLYTQETGLVSLNAKALPYPVTVYHISGGNKGVIGTIEDDEALTEAIPRILGSDDKYLYLGGNKTLWVYDGVRGGLHPVFRDTGQTAGGWVQMLAKDKAGAAVFWRGQNEYRAADGPKVTTTAGEDSTSHYLESNPFDFNLPFENKSVTRVVLRTDPMASGQQYTVGLSKDGGAYTTVLSHSGSSAVLTEATPTVQTGVEFNYKLWYTANATDSTPPAVRDILFEAVAGEMVRGWEMFLDGMSFINIENEPQDVATFFDSMITLAALETPFTFLHTMSGHLEEDESNSFTVKLLEMEILKTKATEQIVRVLVVEA